MLAYTGCGKKIRTHVIPSEARISLWIVFKAAARFLVACGSPENRSPAYRFSNVHGVAGVGFMARKSTWYPSLRNLLSNCRARRCLVLASGSLPRST